MFEGFQRNPGPHRKQAANGRFRKGEELRRAGVGTAMSFTIALQMEKLWLP